MRNWEYIPPWLLQLVGVIILAGAVAFWVFTGHQSALIMGAAMALIGLGAYSGIRITVHQEIDKAKEKEKETESIKGYAKDHLQHTHTGEDEHGES